MPADTQSRIADRKLWERVLYMLFCAIAYSVAEFVVVVVALFQVACVAFTGSINERAQRLGRNVGAYIFELLQFVTFNDERVPFPFSNWPDETPGETPWRDDAPHGAAAGAAPAAPSGQEPAAPEPAAPKLPETEPAAQRQPAADAPPPSPPTGEPPTPPKPQEPGSEDPPR